MGPAARSLLAASWLLAACATPIQDRSWIEVDTPDFQIVSSLGEAETLELARNLEWFRVFVYQITNAPERPSPIPTRIFAFADETQFGPYRSRREVKGYFLPGLRSNEVAIVKNRMIDARQTILHEYVHFLIRNASSIRYPTWYDEGLAEFLSTAHVRGDRLVLGAAPKHRVASLRYEKWISLPRITRARSYADVRRDEINMFYAQSWALVHYLVLGRGGPRVIGSELDRYLELVESGEPDAAAFEAAFGASPVRTGIALQKYLNGRIPAVSYPLSELGAAPPALHAERMAPDDVLTQLGQLILATDPAGAERHFAAAIAANPSNARAHAGLGDALKLQERWQEAGPHFERALALDPEGLLTQLDYAEYLHESAVRAGLGRAERAARLRRARQRYVSIQKRDPKRPEVYAVYGHSYVAGGATPEKGIAALEHAVSLLPSNADLHLLLAQGYLATGREAEARAIVERQVAWSHSGGQAERVEEILAALAMQLDPVSAGP